MVMERWLHLQVERLPLLLVQLVKRDWVAGQERRGGHLLEKVELCCEKLIELET